MTAGVFLVIAFESRNIKVLRNHIMNPWFSGIYMLIDRIVGTNTETLQDT